MVSVNEQMPNPAFERDCRKARQPLNFTLGVNMLIRELHQILTRLEGRAVRHNDCIWRIEGISAAAEDCKTRLLDAICSQSRPFVAYDDRPTEIPQMADAVQVSLNTWRLPAHVPGSVVLSWLYMGNWQLYVAETPLQQIPDLCRSSDAQVQKFVIDSGVSVVIDSFHDDVSWVVGFGRNAQQCVATDAPLRL